MDARKRGRPAPQANCGAKRSKSESQLVGSKSKPCMKFFSMDGCPFGENCHFLHFFPGGYNAVAQMMNLTPLSTPSTTQTTPSTTTATKSKLCNNYNTTQGCKFGDKCHFAHGPWEIGNPITTAAPSHQDHPPSLPPSMATMASRFVGRIEPPPFQPPPQPQPPPGIAASFGASATAKISVDASLAGAIIGKGGVNSKQICRETGAKLAIRDHENDLNLKNIELEGTFEQIKEASAMVREFILSVSLSGGGVQVTSLPGGPMSNKKTKLCANIAKGSCTFGERCHFAHGSSELKSRGVM